MCIFSVGGSFRSNTASIVGATAGVCSRR